MKGTQSVCHSTPDSCISCIAALQVNEHQPFMLRQAKHLDRGIGGRCNRCTNAADMEAKSSTSMVSHLVSSDQWCSTEGPASAPQPILMTLAGGTQAQTPDNYRDHCMCTLYVPVYSKQTRSKSIAPQIAQVDYNGDARESAEWGYDPPGGAWVPGLSP